MAGIGCSTTTTCLIPQNGYVVEHRHGGGEKIGRAVHFTIGQYDDFTKILASFFFGFYEVGKDFTQILAIGADFALHRSYLGFGVDKATHDGVYIAQASASIVANVDDPTFGFAIIVVELLHGLARNSIAKAGVADVGHAAIDPLRPKRKDDAAVFLEVIALDDVGVVVGRVIEKPTAVAGGIKGRNQGYVAIFELIQHGIQYVEKVFVGGFVVYLGAVFLVDCLPINVFILKQGVFVVDLFPQQLKVFNGAVFGIGFNQQIGAGGKGKQAKQQQSIYFRSVHGAQCLMIFEMVMV